MNEGIEAARTAIDREQYDAASRLLLPHAEAGVAEAQYLLGSLYFCCLEGEPRFAHGWLEKAAAQGHAEALRCLAEWRSDGVTGKPDDERSRGLLIRAAELGSVQAQRDVGCYFALGEEGWPLDLARARYWYGRAAESGHADAQYNFGSMLLCGEGGPADEAVGEDWIRRAAAQGDIAAVRHLREIMPHHPGDKPSPRPNPGS